MAKNITLMGADYPDVPAVTLPQTGGGTATFYDITTETVSTGITGVTAWKYGNVVTISIQMGTSSAASSSGWFLLGTLPEGLRPKAAVNFLGYENRDSNTNMVRAFQIGTNGNLYASLDANQTIQPRALVTYCV